ncbi:cytoskeletal protein RodZ [Saccharomonospora amisosensis]|uniref:Cytoskeletal protein RodZ n=1 Tax=Saccharomonospora amisosensis TaxID=1128677 RepID=A0A7X5UMA5_9PSEU|nr:hypothetical protein [Saccharomonospora amisosensis]NIJ10243.1 cytoskeletal protein RodZ [Saccharomonospora amisosensis]
MLWLFGQIWLWLLLAFALGAGVTAFIFVILKRRAEQAEHTAPPSTSALRQPSEQDDNEQTQRIARVRVPVRQFEEDDEDDAGPPDLGYREGVLPNHREWHERNEWPDEYDVPEEEWQPHQRG